MNLKNIARDDHKEPLCMIPNSQDWMKNLNDNILLSEISIPGTHDSCALYGGDLPICPTLSITDQLNMGTRALNTRCRYFQDQFRQVPVEEQFQIFLKQVRGKGNGFKKIAVPTTEGFELIPAEKVLYCQANDNYTHFTLTDKIRVTACRTLKEIEAQLCDFPFFVRVHHSYLVNLNEVTRYVRGEGGYVVMSDTTSINVSRSRKQALLKFF